MPNPDAIRYKAFLSYSHKDEKWGKRLHEALEAYRIDRDLVGRETPVGKIPASLRPIFADRDDFASGPSLREATSRAIEASEFMIVICSPHAVASLYVNEEIRLFKASGKSERIIPIIIDGEPGSPQLECFPPALRFEVASDGHISDIPTEPIAADAREIADGREMAILKVVAGLLGVGLDEIRKRAARAARRWTMVLASTAGAMGILAIAAGVEAWVGHQRALEAEQRLDWALEAAGSITAKTISFRNKFGVPAPVLSDLLQEVERLLGRLEQQGVNSTDLLSREATLLGALSDGNISTGNTAKALENARQASQKLQDLSAAKGQSSQTDGDIAWSRIRIGDILKQSNRNGEAKQEFLAARQTFEMLAAKEPESLQWPNGLAASLQRLAGALALEGDQEKAKANLDQSLSINRKLLQANPGSTYYSDILAWNLNDRGNLALNSSEFAAAHTLYEEALTINSSLVAGDPTNVDWMDKLAQTQQNVGFSSERQGHLNEALELYRAASDTRRKLSALDPTNVTKLGRLALSISSIGNVYLTTGQLQNAENAFAEVVDIRRRIIALDPLDASERSILTIALAQLAQSQYNGGNTRAALSNFQEASQLAAELIRSDPTNSNAKASRAINLGLMSTIMEAQGDEAGANTAVEEMVGLTDALAADDPTSSLKIYQAFAARQMLAARYRTQGRAKQSLDVLAALREAAEQHKDTGDIVWLGVLGNYYNELYLSEMATGNVADAMTAAQECLDVYKRRSQRDQGSDLAREQLANAYTSAGNADRLLKQREDARSALSEGLTIRKALVDKDPFNAQYKAELAASWSQLNALSWDDGDFAAALSAENHALDIRKDLVANNPADVEMQRILALSYLSVAISLRGLDRRTESRQAFEAALAIRKSLAQAQPGRTDLAADVDQTSRWLANLDQADQANSSAIPAVSLGADPAAPH